MEKTASVRLLQLLGWEGEALTAFLPAWERAIPLLNLTEADIAFAADVWIPKYWDISLKSVRKMIALFFKEAAELAKMEEYLRAGHKVISTHNTSSFVCLYANKHAGNGRLHIIYPDFIISTMWQAFFGKSPETNFEEEDNVVRCSHCALNCTRAREMTKGKIPDPTVNWSWGLFCDEAPKTVELIECLTSKNHVETVLVTAPHDSALGQVEADNEERVQYLSHKLRSSQDRITAKTGITVSEKDMRAAWDAYMSYMERVEEITNLVIYADPQPVSGNELALFSVCMQVCFNLGIEAVNEALDIAIEEIRERIQRGKGPLPKGAPKLACYFVPLNVPWVDRMFRENGVNLSLGRLYPLASMMEERLKSDEDPYLAAARQIYMSHDAVNMGNAASIAESLLSRFPLDGALIGFYDFDRWIGSLQKTEMRLVEERTGIPHFYLEGDFWALNKVSAEDRKAVIRGICNCLKISSV